MAQIVRVATTVVVVHTLYALAYCCSRARYYSKSRYISLHGLHLLRLRVPPVHVPPRQRVHFVRHDSVAQCARGAALLHSTPFTSQRRDTLGMYASAACLTQAHRFLRV